MAQPHLALRTCEDCKRWLFDEEGRPALRRGVRVARPAGVATPCHACPKQSPEQAKHFELSEKNRRTVALYYQVRATFGACLGHHGADPLLAKNMSLIDRVVRQHERAELSFTP